MANGKSRMTLINPEVTDQILSAVASFKADPRFDLTRQHAAYQLIHAEAVRHSVGIEFSARGQRRKSIVAIEDDLRSAHGYFHDHYRGDLDEGTLMACVVLLEPSLGLACYRNASDPTTRAAGMPMIYPRDVADQMERFVPENNSLGNSIDKAFHAHFHITRIHPFKDGNGRLARLVQNGILMHDGLPPVKIHTHDRKNYIESLNRAQRSYAKHENRLSSETSPFFEYLATGLKNSLEEAQRHISR